MILPYPTKTDLAMQLLDERQAAHLLGCSVHKLQKDRRKGSPIPFLKIGRCVRYRKEDLEAYIISRTFISTSEYERGKR